MTNGDLIGLIIISIIALVAIAAGISLIRDDVTELGVLCNLIGIVVLTIVDIKLFKEFCPEGAENVKSFWNGIKNFLNTPLN